MHQASSATACIVTASRCVLCIQLTQVVTVVALFRVANRSLDDSELRVAIEHKLDREPVSGQEFLRDMCNRELRWHLEGSGIRVQLAAYHGEQARLATAVLAGNSDLLAAKQAKSSV